jgi:hypothetical protein
MNASDFDLTGASRVYGVANTPLFLVRKLQADPAIRALGERCTGEKIIAALRQALSAEPVDSVDAVRPYALLVALWFKPEIEHLKEAARLQGGSFTWYSLIAETLLSTFSPVHTQVVQVPGCLPSPIVSPRSSTPTKLITLR